MSSKTRSLATALGLWKKSNLGRWNVTNYAVTESPQATAHFTIPGLSHESFDVDGNPKMTSIMMTSVLSRIYALHRPDQETGDTFLDWAMLTKDRLTFVSSTEYQLSTELYDKSVQKWPLDASFRLRTVGNTSVCHVIDFYIPGEEASPLWTNVTQLVSVDKTTRKPLPLPDWFKDKYRDKGVFDKGLIIKPFDRPTNTYEHPTPVNWSDTDNYKHTNFSSYVRFALDALHAALRKEQLAAEKSKSNVSQSAEGEETSKQDKPLQGITKEIIARGVRDLRICYLSESLEGEELVTHVWQCPGESNIVQCSVARDSEDLCQMKFVYY